MDQPLAKTTTRKEPFARLDESEVFALAEDKMKHEKYYLDPYLTMESLAAELNVHRNVLSRAVNRCAGVTFPQWLTTYRVEELERLAELAENHSETLEQLSRRAGFSNRTSFYRSFKDIRGISPAEWKKMKGEARESGQQNK